MNQSLVEWLKERGRINGLRAVVLRFPDSPGVSESFDDGLSVAALEAAWPRLFSVLQSAKREGLPSSRSRFAYAGAELQCAARADGACLGMVLCPNLEAEDLAGVSRLIDEFHRQ